MSNNSKSTVAKLEQNKDKKEEKVERVNEFNGPRASIREKRRGKAPQARITTTNTLGEQLEESRACTYIHNINRLSF